MTLLKTTAKTSTALFLTLVLIAWLVFSYPLTAFAADASESFDDYAGQDETSLVGKNGGSGWGQAWQDPSAGANDDWLVEDDTFCFSNQCAGNEADSTTNDTADVDRDFTEGIQDGYISFNLRRADLDANVFLSLRKTDGTSMALLHFERTGLEDDVNLIGASTQVLGQWTASTWHLYEAAWGEAGSDAGGSGNCAANQIEARLDSGTWSSCIGYQNSQTGDIESLLVEVSSDTWANDDFMIDEISITDAGAGAAVVDYSNFHIYIGWTEF